MTKNVPRMRPFDLRICMQRDIDLKKDGDVRLGRKHPAKNQFQILTCFMYFPGLIHGLSLIRSEGTWTDNYHGTN